MTNYAKIFLNLKQISFIVLLISLFLFTLSIDDVQAQPFAYVTNTGSANVSVIDIATNRVVATVGVGDDPLGIAITPDGAFAYVINERSNTISVIDIATNTIFTTISIGARIFDIAITPDGAFAYVTKHSSNSVAIIDIATNSIVTTVGVGGGPRGVAITPDGAFAYVINHASNNVSVIDIAKQSIVATVGVGASPLDVAFTPDGAFVYVTNTSSNNVSVIDIAKKAVVATVGVGNSPNGVAITPDGAFAYITNSISGSVSVIDIAKQTVVATVGIKGRPLGIAITPDGAFAYVTDEGAGSVSVIDIAKNSLVATVDVGTSPFGIAIATAPVTAPTGILFAYVAIGENDVSVISVAANTVVANVGVGSEPGGIAITPDGAFVYVTNSRSEDVSVIDIVKQTVVATVDVGSFPFGIAITPDGAFAYVANEDAGNVSVIEIASNIVVATVDVGSFPFGIAITPDGALAYITNPRSGNVSVIDIAKNTVVAIVGIMGRPYGIAITPDGAFAYVSNEDTDNVSVIEIATNDVVATVEVGSLPQLVAITPDGAFAYIPNYISSNVSVIATATNTVVTTIAIEAVVSPYEEKVRSYPFGVAITPDGAFAYVTDGPSGNVFVIEIATNDVVAIVEVGSFPGGIAITPFPPSHTPPGNDIVVQPKDSATGTSPVSVTFSEVTSSGETSLTISSGGPAPPAGFGLGTPAVYYDISTTAGFNPPVEVCINYTGIKFGGKEENLNLSHFEDTDGDGISDKWVTLTTSSQDIENNIICVSVTSFSLFAIFEPLSGVIAGTVSVNAVGLAGVNVTLLDADELPVGIDPIITGAAGLYSFADVIPDDYKVIIVEPLGYSVDANPKLAPLAPGGTTTVNFALTEVVLSNNARGMGYWKHQFNVYVNEKGKAQESPEELTLYIERVHQVYTPHFDVFDFSGNTTFETFEYWQSVFTVSRKAAMLDRAVQQLAALVLNFASLKIGQYEVVTADGHTAGDVLTFVSTLVTDYEVSNDELAKDLAEMVNNHQEISAGIVSAGGILYKVAGGDINWSFVPTEFALHNNYPNPFNPVTTISYNLPVVSDVKIVIYNIMGQEVRHWDIQGQSAGNHRVSWDALNVASGMYFYRLQAGDFVETRKMILLK